MAILGDLQHRPPTPNLALSSLHLDRKHQDSWLLLPGILPGVKKNQNKKPYSIREILRKASPQCQKSEHFAGGGQVEGLSCPSGSH